jgi:dethiobiotin synthetase
MKPYFITGSGTGIGKTLFTCALAYQLRQAGKTVRALKPVISGFEQAAADSDTLQLIAARGLAATPENVEAVSPWRFKAPLSPDMAAQDEGRALGFEKLVSFCKAQSGADYLLVEGVGGVMVPLDERHTVLDWMAALAFPVILVTGNYLGSLSHTLTAAQALRAAGLELAQVVISESESSPVPIARTEETLRRFLPPQTGILSIGRLDSSREIWKDVTALAHHF